MSIGDEQTRPGGVTGVIDRSLPKQIPIETMVNRVTEVSTLPHIALKVMEVARNPNTTAADLRTVVEGDPPLSARVLRTVNSAAYAVRTKVTNLQQAISLLGFNQIRNLAITASVSGSFRNDKADGPYRRSTLWRHLVSVGICARLIAARTRLPDFEDAFLAGLLHDFGVIVEDQHAGTRFQAMLAELRGDRPLIDVEQEYLGFNHTTLGARLAEMWKFPAPVRAAIRFHHFSDKCTGEDAPIVQCVALANFICTLKGIPSVGLKLVEMPRAAIAALAFQKEDLKVLVADLDEEMARYENLYQL
jgi:HD-like signal output (HDOD) protein